MEPRDIESDLTADRLRKVLRYEPETGKFYWLKDSNQNKKSGDEAGSRENNGYIRITVFGRRYQAHRLAWLWMMREWPSDRIDHENRTRSDNRWVNLRAASDLQNSGNRPLKDNHSTGFKGVELHVSGKYRARIQIDGKLHGLGLFETAQDAHAAYVEAACKHFGEFARAS